ncbi:hypothetical protein CUMW_074330 [Citrus unshiu]|nr:hypothetical protein CUMW_074330 [Citrus unshiu]
MNMITFMSITRSRAQQENSVYLEHYSRSAVICKSMDIFSLMSLISWNNNCCPLCQLYINKIKCIMKTKKKETKAKSRMRLFLLRLAKLSAGSPNISLI